MSSTSLKRMSMPAVVTAASSEELSREQSIWKRVQVSVLRVISVAKPDIHQGLFSLPNLVSFFSLVFFLHGDIICCNGKESNFFCSIQSIKFP